jgi:hypothetical protein
MKKEQTREYRKKSEDINYQELPFEFILYVNNNIICQRFFDITNYNEEVLKSYELKELMDEITGMDNDQTGRLGIIPKYLKTKSVDYLWNSYNPYMEHNENTYKAPPKKGDVFKFEIKVNKKVVAASEFPNEFFTLNPKISVDIREVIYPIMNQIRFYMSRKNYQLIA